MILFGINEFCMKMLESALDFDDLYICNANSLFFMYLLPVSSRMFSRSSISRGSSAGSGFSGVELAVVSSLFWAIFLLGDFDYCFVGGSCFFYFDYYLAILRIYLSFLVDLIHNTTLNQLTQ